ncbi:hypothetical protein ZWY2020_029863 [Hordeum vulgare]|nr:hypothetical protein ZWY2020_029863 [Hordeum vulgare]
MTATPAPNPPLGSLSSYITVVLSVMAGVARGMGHGDGDGSSQQRTVGMAVIADVHGAGHASITIGQGRGGVFVDDLPSRSGGRGHGSGSAAIYSSRGGQSSECVDDINRCGYATGAARHGGIYTGLDVPLPIPTPKKVCKTVKPYLVIVVTLLAKSRVV